MEVSDQNIVALILLAFRSKCSWQILRYSEAVVRKCSVKRVLLNISQNSWEKYCAGVFFFQEVAGRLEKRFRHMCFPTKSAKFSRTSLLKNTSGRLIMDTKLFQAIFHLHSRKLWNFSRKFLCENC